MKTTPTKIIYKYKENEPCLFCGLAFSHIHLQGSTPKEFIIYNMDIEQELNNIKCMIIGQQLAQQFMQEKFDNIKYADKIIDEIKNLINNINQNDTK